MTLFVVETQRATYVFACPAAAESFAAAERQWWIETCPPMGRPPIDPVPLGPQHRFRPNLSGWGSIDPAPLIPGPGQDRCNRVRRHVRRWERERDAWLDQAGV